MHTLVACFANLANNSVLANLTPVTDPLVTVQNAHFIFPFTANIGAFQVLVPNLTQARVNTPSLRNVALPDIYPATVGGVQGTNPVVSGPLWDTMRVPMNDEFFIEVSRGGAGAADCFAGIWFSPGKTPPPGGPIFTVRATASITLTDGTWVAANMTLSQSLPYGSYAVVGMTCICTSGIFARLAFPGVTQYRPGVPVVETYGSYVNPPMFRWGNFDLFGTFDSTAQPLIEILGYAAGAQTATVLLDLIKVR
jgi:hypothetical protein